jgi:hypothetical protein
LVGFDCLLSVGTPYSQGYHRTVNSALSPSFFGEADRCQPLVHVTPKSPVAHRTVWCRLVTVGQTHVSSADCATDRWPGVRLAHQIVRCTLDSLVNFSCGAQGFPESSYFVGAPAWAPNTVRCIPDSSVYRRLLQVWLDLAKLLQYNFYRFEKIPST